jgi:two-component system, chemotaxis family, CheB/CheR fusion protein
MGSILASLSAGVVVVDRDLLVRVWNDTAQDMWGLRATEVIGTNLLALDSGLPVDAILAMVRDVAAGRSPAGEVATSARNRLGRAILCRMTVTPLRMDGDVAGAVLVMEDGGTPDGGTRSDGV